MDKVKIIIIVLCLLLLGRSVLPQSFKTVSQPTKHFSIAQSHGAQGQTTTEEPDEEDEDDDEDEEDDDED